MSKILLTPIHHAQQRSEGPVNVKRLVGKTLTFYNSPDVAISNGGYVVGQILGYYYATEYDAVNDYPVRFGLHRLVASEVKFAGYLKVTEDGWEWIELHNQPIPMTGEERVRSLLTQ